MTKKTIEQVEASISRWQTRLKRAVNAIDRLQRQRKRLAKVVKAETPKPAVSLAETYLREIIEPKPVEIDTSIPSFLRRTADPATEQLKQEIADTKRKKAAGRVANKKAKQSGETKRMPLTGRAALDAIRNG